MTRRKRPPGEYHPLVWDGDGEPCGHYVNGHVTPEVFRAALDTHFGDSTKWPTIPADAAIEHVHVRSARVEDDGYGQRQYEWRHTTAERGFPMTYWEVRPNRNSGATP